MDGIAQLALTLAVGTVASFAVFKLSVLLYERVKSPLLNPLLVTVASSSRRSWRCASPWIPTSRACSSSRFC